MADEQVNPPPVTKQYWVIFSGSIDGCKHERGESVNLSTVDGERFRDAGIGLSFAKPEAEPRPGQADSRRRRFARPRE